jgi:tetratricopeptide (TPR) repeat protein
MQAAELFIKRQEVERAIENWVRITQLDSGHIQARNYLAMVHERLGHKTQAINEYLAIASLEQQGGNAGKAAEMIGRALRINPASPEARQAQNILRSGQPLPKPMRSVGDTGMLRIEHVKQLKPSKAADTGLDPIAETNKRALARLAEVLFDLSEDVDEFPTSRSGSMSAIVKGTGQAEGAKSERTRILLHVGQAIECQTSGREDHAMEELEKALEAGFKDPAAYFNLGYLRSRTERLESAIRNLQNAVKNEAYSVGTRLLLGQVLRQMNRLPEASMEYMEALKAADSSVVPTGKSAELRQAYEPFIEAQAQVSDEAALTTLCDNIHHLLVQPNWRSRLLQAREQLPEAVEDAPAQPLAEILVQAQSSAVLEAMSRVRSLARAGHLRTAQEEAFESLHASPTYLPLHSLIGDLLLQDGRTQDAIAKYTVVAQAYSSRGEASQAVSLLRRIVQSSPMDMSARSHLIDQLAAQGLVDEAIGEYLDMADIYYRLAELDLARKTYTTALRLAQQGGAKRAWNLKLLQRMADIDMQRLDWKQALRIYEQIRTIQPEDMQVRKDLIQLNLRLGQAKQAVEELESFKSYLQSTGRQGEAIPFLEDLINENPKQPILRRALAEEYRQAGKHAEAIAQLDQVGQMLLESGEKENAVQVLENIIAMNPPNVSDYTAMLAKVRSGT